MAVSINWPTKVIFVPKADTTLLQVSPEVRTYNVDSFRLELKDLESSEAGMPFIRTHNHNTEVTLSGVTYARTIEIINGYTIEFEDGQYSVVLSGGNNNLSDVKVANQVSIVTNNSAGNTSSKETQDQSYLDTRVYIDTVNGTSGTLFPKGTPGSPVISFEDAESIVESRIFPKRYGLSGPITFDNIKEITNITTTADVLGSLDGTYFYLEDNDGTVAFWFDVDNSGTTEPAHGADRSVVITTVNQDDPIGTVGDKVYTSIIADSKFEAGSNDNAGNLTIVNSEFGTRTKQAAGSSGFSVVENIDGDQDLLSYTDWKGTNTETDIMTFNNVNTLYTNFENLVLTGTINGKIYVKNCVVDSLTNYEGDIGNSGLKGTLTLPSSPTVKKYRIYNSHTYSLGTGNVIIDCNNATDLDFVIADYDGALEIRNFSHTANTMIIDLNSGKVTLDATCTDGTIIIRGTGELINNSVGTTVIRSGLASHDDIADAVWDEDTSQHTLTDSFGELQDKQLKRIKQSIALNMTKG